MEINSRGRKMSKILNRWNIILLVFLFLPISNSHSSIREEAEIKSIWDYPYNFRYRAIPFLIKDYYYIYYENYNHVIIRDIEDPYNQFLIADYQLKSKGIIVEIVEESNILFIYYVLSNDVNTKGFELVDISNINQPHFLGSIELTNYRGSSTNIFIQDNFCYLIVHEEILDPIYIINFEKTCDLAITGIYETPNQYIRSFAVLDDIMYVQTTRDTQFEIANISDKSTPQLIKALNVTYGLIQNIQDDIIVSSSDEEIFIVDISDKLNPKLLNSLDFDETHYDDLHDVTFWDDYIGVVCTNHFEISDISDRRNIKRLSDWHFEYEDYGCYIKGKVSNDRLYLSRSSYFAEQTLHIFDITNLNQPKLIYPASHENSLTKFISPILISLLVPGVFIFSSKKSKIRRKCKTIWMELIKRKKVD